MQWWCSAQGVAWTWQWRPYVGVWLLIALLAAAYLVLRRRIEADEGPWRPVSFAAGLLALWVALDWPVGALAAGYLASVHMVQFLLVGVVAPALLLLGLPREAFVRLSRRPAAVGALRRLTQPLVAIALFNLVVGVTHWPTIVDGLMGTQIGSFGIDMLWLSAGLVFWWPVICPVPARPGFSDFLKMGYLILNTIVSTAPFFYLTFSHLPVYATYELAPPIEGITKREDQQLAGILMKVGGGVILWTAISILFFRWHQREEAGELQPARPH